MNLTGNTVVITGATSGIGLAFANQFYKRQNKVIICGRREERLKEISGEYPGMITRACDVSHADERTDFFNWIASAHPDANILINNAGVQYAFDFTHQPDMKKISEEIETNLAAPIHLCALFAEHLAAKERAAIINISSGLAFVPIAFMPVYCATKAAIHSFTLSLRYQLRNTTVKVFEIAPPPVDTELGHDRREDKSQTHGGISVEEFITPAMEGLENDAAETAVGMAKNLREKNEMMFNTLNK
jgi:uncharacterized oxidoreductase